MKNHCSQILLRFTVLFFAVGGIVACKKGVKEQKDELYSRHLQRKVALTVISTPMPDKNTDIHLLLFNDGQLLDELAVAHIADSMYRKKRIPHLVIVGIQSANRRNEFGIASETEKSDAGGKADHYDSFVINELYPFIKKKAGVRKFRSVTIAGFGAGGLSALDIAWNNADKINKVAVFSGAFSRKEKNANDTSAKGIMYDKLRVSRKQPHLQFWLYAGDRGTTGLSNDDAENIMAATDSIVAVVKNKKFVADADVVYQKGQSNDRAAWKQSIPFFLEWAFLQQ